jgi:hypothetical protein
MSVRLLRSFSLISALAGPVMGCAHHELTHHEAAQASLEPINGNVWRHRWTAADGTTRDAVLVTHGPATLLVDPPDDPAYVRDLVHVATRELDAAVVGVVLTRPIDPRALGAVPRSATIYVDGGRAALDLPDRRVLPLECEDRTLAGIRFASRQLDGRPMVWLPDAGVVLADGRVIVPESTAGVPGDVTPPGRRTGR